DAGRTVFGIGVRLNASRTISSPCSPPLANRYAAKASSVSNTANSPTSSSSVVGLFVDFDCVILDNLGFDHRHVGTDMFAPTLVGFGKISRLDMKDVVVLDRHNAVDLHHLRQHRGADPQECFRVLLGDTI